MSTIVVSVTVVSDIQGEIARAVESMARCAAGLALEGISVSLSIGSADDEDGEED